MGASCTSGIISQTRHTEWRERRWPWPHGSDYGVKRNNAINNEIKANNRSLIPQWPRLKELPFTLVLVWIAATSVTNAKAEALAWGHSARQGHITTGETQPRFPDFTNPSLSRKCKPRVHRLNKRALSHSDGRWRWLTKFYVGRDFLSDRKCKHGPHQHIFWK